MIAERIVQLGNSAKGTVQEINKRTSLPAYPTDIYKVADHLAALIERYAACANAIRMNIDDTADLLTEVSRGLDKQLWFLEAFVQEPNGTFRG